MTTPNSQFYVVGGTVNPDSPSYVVRKADQELYDRLLAGEFCYVLTSRQMGKSSLMARTARRLTTEARIHAAIVDLTQIGTERNKLSAEQWYYGIAHRILRELKLRDVNLSEWWQSRSQLPALQRLTEFFRDLLLEQIEGQIVIFIDEIDSTISLPFTDDFFAAIRACHNARATDAAYNRLSFVLLGVASPSDLVKDATRTPFNIGHRIELEDFTNTESAQLAFGLILQGFDMDSAITTLARVMCWTEGHPYLTQKLLEEILNRGGTTTLMKPEDIDSLVRQKFFSRNGQHTDPNLCFVRDWLTKNYSDSQEFLNTVMSLYEGIYNGNSVIYDPISKEQAKLKLAGLVKVDQDQILQVRNNIYRAVFNHTWLHKVGRLGVPEAVNSFKIQFLFLLLLGIYGAINPRFPLKPRWLYVCLSLVAGGGGLIWLLVWRRLWRRRGSRF